MVKLDINFIFVNPKNITIKGGYLMKLNYSTTIKRENENYATLSIKYCTSGKDLLFGINYIINKVLKANFIYKKDVKVIKVYKKDNKVKIEVDYKKNEVAPKAKIKYQRKVIRNILKRLGYAKEEIKKVAYEDEKWNIEICEFYEIDEYDSIKDRKDIIFKIIKEELNIEVNISIS